MAILLDVTHLLGPSCPVMAILLDVAHLLGLSWPPYLMLHIS